jgi:hypothetical protein
MQVLSVFLYMYTKLFLAFDPKIIALVRDVAGVFQALNSAFTFQMVSKGFGASHATLSCTRYSLSI